MKQKLREKSFKKIPSANQTNDQVSTNFLD